MFGRQGGSALVRARVWAECWAYVAWVSGAKPDPDSVEYFLAALDARAVAEGFVDLASEVTERIAIETSHIYLIDRLRAAVGGHLVIEVGGRSYSGVLVQVLFDALRVDCDGRACLVASSAIDTVLGLTECCVDPGGLGQVERRLGMASVLRRWLTLRVCVELRDGTRRAGSLIRVGADQIDLVTASARVSIATEAICVVELACGVDFAG